MCAGNIKVGHGILYGRTDDILEFCHTTPSW
jgi:ribosomal protein L24E